VALRYLGGHQFTTQDSVPMPPLAAGDATDVSVDMKSPSEPGIFQGKWRMATADGDYFGDVIWVILSVCDTGTLGVTQQLSRLSWPSPNGLNFQRLEDGTSLVANMPFRAQVSPLPPPPAPSSSPATNPFSLSRRHFSGGSTTGTYEGIEEEDFGVNDEEQMNG
jgi:hypothetical protein